MLLMAAPQILLPIAQKAQEMARSAGADDSLIFQRVAAASMCLVAVASGMHGLTELYRTLYPGHRHQGHAREGRGG